jgi:hypothetical protein
MTDIVDKIASLIESVKHPQTAEQKIIDGYGVRFWQEIRRRHPDVSAEKLLADMESFGF